MTQSEDPLPCSQNVSYPEPDESNSVTFLFHIPPTSLVTVFFCDATVQAASFLRFLDNTHI